MKILLVKDEPVLRAYDLHRRGALTLPATPINEFTELN